MKKLVEIGEHQGFILGPLLYIIYLFIYVIDISITLYCIPRIFAVHTCLISNN